VSNRIIKGSSLALETGSVREDPVNGLDLTNKDYVDRAIKEAEFNMAYGTVLSIDDREATPDGWIDDSKTVLRTDMYPHLSHWRHDVLMHVDQQPHMISNTSSGSPHLYLETYEMSSDVSGSVDNAYKMFSDTDKFVIHDGVDWSVSNPSIKTSWSGLIPTRLYNVSTRFPIIIDIFSTITVENLSMNASTLSFTMSFDERFNGYGKMITGTTHLQPNQQITETMHFRYYTDEIHGYIASPAPRLNINLLHNTDASGRLEISNTSFNLPVLSGNFTNVVIPINWNSFGKMTEVRPGRKLIMYVGKEVV